MKTQFVSLISLSRERTLRQDFDFHSYSNMRSANYYNFNELFQIVRTGRIAVDDLYRPFLYCEIGDVDHNGGTSPVMLNFLERSLLDEAYYKKIEKGDIISVEEGDILIAKVRPNLKKYVRITGDLTDTFFTSAFMRIKAKKIPDIMYYCFRNLFYQDLMAIARQGKGYPTLSETDMAALRFDKTTVDKLVDQSDRLSQKIQAVEAEIRHVKEALKTTSSIIDEVFAREFGFDYDTFEGLKGIKSYTAHASWFANNPDLRFSAKFHRPAGEYVMSELNRITNKKIKHFLAEPIVLGASVSPGDYDDEGEGRYISMATIKNWKFDPDSANLLSVRYFQAKMDKTVGKNDIIMARSGEGTIGKVALIEGDGINGIFADFTMRIRLKDYSSRFAYFYFRSNYFQYLIEIFKKGLGNNTNIFPIILREFPIPDISLDEQQRIVDEITAEIEAQEQIHTQISELRKQIDCIITEAITA